MKKILLSLTILLLWAGSSWGQVNLYSFSSSSGTYTAISGGTLLISGTSTMDSWASTVQTIPSFTFDDVNYTTAYVTSNGILTLGGVAPSAYTTTGIGTTTGSGIAICPFSADLDRATQTTSTEIRWETIGDEIIFQWQQVKRYGQTESFDFQVRLNTVNGEVKFIYQLNSGPGSGTSYQPQVGIRTSTTDYKNRLVASGAENWDTSLPGTANTNTCRFTSAAPAKNFTTGLTYTFTPPLPCSGTPDPGNTVSSLENACPGVDFTLSLENSIPGTGVTYQWQYSVTGVDPWTDMGTAATQVASQTVSTYYRCYVTCENSEESAFSNSLLVSMFVAPIPYEEGFLTTAVPSCWNTTGWLIGSVRGVTGNPGNNIYKNFYSFSPTASFKTCMIGPVSTGMTLTFDYKVANWGAPYAPPASGSGNFIVSVSDDGGTTFNDLETVVNNGVAAWQTKSYPLDDYDGKNIMIRITGNWVSGDWDMAFDNIKVAIPPACPPPFNLTISEITQSSANIGWTKGGDEEMWNLLYGETGFDPDTQGTLITGITTNTYTLEGLEASSEYDVYVQADCDGGSKELSEWAGPITFKTLCDPISAFPWIESFEDVVIPAFPDCWLKESGNWVTTNNANSTNDADARTGTQFLRERYSSSNSYIWTPGFAVQAGISYDFSFWWAGDNYAGWDGDVFFNHFQTSEDAIHIETFVESSTTTTKTYAQFLYTFVPDEDGIYYFAIRINSTSSPWYLSFDDFRFEPTPSCVAPTNLAVSDITQNSAKIDWTPGGDEEIWNLLYGKAGFDPDTQGTLITGITTNTYTLGGLDASTEYNVYVQANCNGDNSPWAGPLAFVTECGSFTLPFAEDFEGATFPPMCWSIFDLNNDEILWASGTTNHTPGGSKSAYHNYSYGAGGLGSDGWLVTPQFQMPENSVINLSFWSNHTFPTYYTKNAVWISTGSGNPVDGDFEEIWSPASVTASWVKTDLNLTTYAGQMVYIAFQYEGYDGHAWYLDDILIESFMPANLAGNVSGGRGPIEGARVFTEGYEAFTDENGDYLIEDIIAGTYDISCEAEGFLTKLVEDFELDEGDNTLDFVLNFAQIAVDPESFEVELLPGGQKTEMLNISNPAGTGPLTWNAQVSFNAKDRSYQHFNFSSNFSNNYKEDALLSGDSHAAATPTREYTTCPEGSLFSLEPDLDDWAIVTSEEDPGYVAFQYFSDVDKPIGGITFWGGNLIYSGGWNACNNEDPMPFIIEFYTDFFGEPDEFVASFSASISRVDTQIPIGDFGNFYLYSIEFDEPINLSSGWIAIQGQTSTPDCWFMWAGTYEGVGTPYLQWDGVAFAVGDYALSMCLTEFGGIEWLSLSNYSGIVQPGSDEDIQLNFYSSGLEEGTYNATIKITHDGQNVSKGVVEVPVTMHVFPPCPRPKDLTVDEITQNSALLDWTAVGEETTWNLKYGTPGFDPETEGTFVGGIAKPYLLESLNHSSDYAFRVQAVCDDNELSDWSLEKIFSTLCGVNELPFVEDFEGVGFPPKCWNNYNVDGGGTQWVVSSAQNHTPGGSKSAFHNYSSVDDEGWLVTPQIQLPENTEITLSFWSYNTFPTWYEENSVLISTLSDDPLSGDFIEIWNPDGVVQSWEETILSLTGYAGEKVYIAFKYAGYNAHGWYLDDVQIFVTGNVEGYVSEATSPKNRTPIEGARVFTGNYETFTDETGYYKLEGLKAGFYDISCEAENYFTSVEENFEIVEDDTKSLNFTLDFAQIAVDPDEFNVVLPHESIKIEKLTISNPGGTAPLTWDASLLFSRRSYTVHPVPEGETKFIEANLAQANSIPGGAPRENLTRDDEIVLHYDGENANAIGAGGGDLYYAARFPSAMVAQYAGFSLEYVDVYIWDVPFSSTLMIWGAGTTTEPGTLLYQQEFEAVEEWNTINLDEPLLLDGTDIWVGYHVEYDAGEFPGGSDAGPADPDGAWISVDGENWARLYELNPDFDYNWNIRAYLLPPSGSWLSISPKSGVVPVGGTSEITLSFNSSGLEEGDYHATIKINHDGQEVGKGQVQVPVTMGVYPYCPKPKDLTATLVNPTAFDLGWTPMGETSVFNVLLTDEEDFVIGGEIEPYDSFEGIEDNPLFVEDLEPETDYWFYVQADCGETEFDAPKVNRYWLDINTQGDIGPANSGGTANEIGEDGTWYFYNDPETEQSWYSVWFYNNSLDMYGMNKMKMGFYVQKGVPFGAANMSFAVSYSDPEWDPETPGFPMPDDEEFILRSTLNGPYSVTGTAANKQWFELEFDIPDYNPEWISVNIFGSNIKIDNTTMTKPSSDIGLDEYWDVNATGCGIIVHESLPKTKSAWAGPKKFTTLPLCPTPTNLTVSDITATSAVFDWDAGFNETTWNLKYYEVGVGDTVFANSITKPYPVTDLTPNTNYAFMVQADCGGGDVSAWAAPKAFSTPCEAYPLPFAEDFEGVVFPPDCWSRYNIDGGGSQWTSSTTYNHTQYGSKSAYHMYASGNQDGWLVTPLIQLHETKKALLSFWSYNQYPGDYGKNSVLISTGSGDPDDEEFELLWSPETVTQQWEETELDLEDFIGESVYIAFRYEGNFAHSWYVDDILIDLAPTCPAPTALTVSEITTTSALLEWTAGGTEATWNLKYGEPGFDPETEGTLISGITTNPFLLEGLNSSTAYAFSVQADCGEGDVSAWSVKETFATLCEAISNFPWTEGFEGVTLDSIPNCWFKESGNWVTTNNASSTYDADARTGTQFLRERWSASNAYIWTPGFAVQAGKTYEFSFWWAGDGYSGWTGDVFMNTLQISTGATQVGTSFVTSGTTTTKTYAQFLHTFVPEVDGIYYFAIRVNSTSSPWYISFDDFEFNEIQTGPPENQTVSGSLADCYDALEVLTIENAQVEEGNIAEFRAGETINASDFTVEEDAAAYLYAGQNIVLGEGVHVAQGADFLATIMDEITYCEQAATMVTAKSEEIAPAVITPAEMDAMFTVYPNPTTGRFTLMMKEADESSVINVEIFGLMGERVLQTQLFGQNQYEFDLSGSPKGVYIVRVLNGKQTSIEKLIKQ